MEEGLPHLREVESGPGSSSSPSGDRSTRGKKEQHHRKGTSRLKKLKISWKSRDCPGRNYPNESSAEGHHQRRTLLRVVSAVVSILELSEHHEVDVLLERSQDCGNERSEACVTQEVCKITVASVERRVVGELNEAVEKEGASES